MPTLEEALARPRGRRVPELPLHTFKDSGYTCRLHKLSPMTLQRLLEALRKEAKKKAAGEEGAYPKAPVEMIAVGGGEEIPEENKQDEDYLAKVRAWDAWAINEANERFLRIAAVDACVFPEEEYDEQAITRFRRRMAQERAPLDIPDSYDNDEINRIVWLFHFCFGSNDDTIEFYSALTERASVKAEQVEAEIATFPAAG